MDTNEEFYKRKEDLEWRKKVDHEQVTLMTGHQVLSQRLEDLEDKMEEVDDLLRGEPLQDKGGLIEQIHDLQISVNRLIATIFVDSTGKRGMAHDVDFLMGREKHSEISSGRRWAFWGMVLTSLISSGALILTKWDVISKNVLHKDLGKIENMIGRPKRTKPKRRRVVLPPPPETEDSDD